MGCTWDGSSLPALSATFCKGLVLLVSAPNALRCCRRAWPMPLSPLLQCCHVLVLVTALRRTQEAVFLHGDQVLALQLIHGLFHCLEQHEQQHNNKGSSRSKSCCSRQHLQHQPLSAITPQKNAVPSIQRALEFQTLVSHAGKQYTNISQQSLLCCDLAVRAATGGSTVTPSTAQTACGSPYTLKFLHCGWLRHAYPRAANPAVNDQG